MKKLALIWCLSAPEDEPLKTEIIDSFGSENNWDVLSPDDDVFLSKAVGYDGYVISGSPRSVVDDAETQFVKNVLTLIREVRDTSASPIVGICFGAQSLATALGGKVGRNPGGVFKLGVDSLTWTGPAQRWAETSKFAVLVQSHGECVLELPPDSVHLASSATISHEIFLTHGRFLGVQGHPEADNALLRHFMTYHRSHFDADAWQAIEREADQPLSREPVIALGRRLIGEGTLL
jgi:GMP synthase (glutamine-hydrolysing)